MAQNLFEKYGIKEVADVTLFKIERKDETLESQRKIDFSSILKGALTLDTVYPLDEDGKGDSEGYQAYVFKDADILTHFNYDCDDKTSIEGTGFVVDTGDGNPVFEAEEYAEAIEYYSDEDNFKDAIAQGKLVIKTAYDSSSLRNVIDKIDVYLSDFDYTISNISIDKMELYDSNNKKTTLDVNGLFTDDRTVKILFTKKASYSDTPGPESFTIEVPQSKCNDWTTIYEAIDRLEDVDLTVDDINYYTRAITGSEVATSTVTFKAGSKVTFVLNDEDKTIEFDEDTTVAGIPNSVINDIVNGTNRATVQEKIMAILAILEEVVADVDPDEITAENIKNIVFNIDVAANPIYIFTYKIDFGANEDIDTGIFDTTKTSPDTKGHYKMDPDKAIGTHEFSYAEQVCMLFAKNQNLITKRGTRYHFANPESLFGDVVFDDDFAAAPNSTERVVVCGLAGKISENLYDVEEINAAIKNIPDSIKAKAYVVKYTDYAELVVEDEMGYYLPDHLGVYDKSLQAMKFFDTDDYAKHARIRRGIDTGISGAINTWGNDRHYSINDAIDALKQEQKLLDGETGVTSAGQNRIFGGYLVKGKDVYNDDAVNNRPFDDGGYFYEFTKDGKNIKTASGLDKVVSGYSLDSVLTAIASMETLLEGSQIRVESTVTEQSNRAIYVDANQSAASANAHIYLLKNIHAKSIATDTDGIFEFYDKKGNKLNYQDKVFAGTAYLALVVIGQSGLVFVVNRHGTKNIEKTAWMVNEKGYLTDSQASKIVKNGLIHTVDVTVCDESFDATCTVGSIKVKKTKKNVLKYTPVLFLDTLKVSTLEQASEKTSATGGSGNSKLITWDYGKEITLSIEDALYTPASMAAIWGGEHGDVKNGVKDTHVIDRTEKITAKRNFIIPAGNSLGVPTEGDMTATTVYFDLKTMEPYQDGTPIAEGEVLLKFTRSVAYDNNSIGNTIEISADAFPGTYKVVGETCVRDKATGEDQRFQFIIPEAKMSADSTAITLEAEGDPAVFSFTMDVQRPENGVMIKFVQFDVEENTEENDGSTMVKNTENLNLLDDAEMFKVSGEDDEEFIIGATEY